MRKAKNDWLQEKARAVEVGMLTKGSRGGMWKSLRELQGVRAGLRPKKGDLSVSDNWRGISLLEGISLLDVGGKLSTKVMQSRLQNVAEEVLHDSQCGFRKGRGTWT